MSVQRVPSAPFAQIANEALRDSRLSFKARGLLAMVLSHSGEWIATRRWLEAQSQHDGRASVQSALDELTEYGYRSVSYERIGAEIRTVVVWRHTPEVSISCPTENLSDREPDRQETGRTLEHNSSEHHQEEHHQEQHADGAAVGEAQALALVPLVLAPDQGQTALRRIPGTAFDQFWEVYPRKAAKAAAAKAWGKALLSAPAEVIIAGADRYRLDPNREPQFTAHASTWLNQERWSDDPLPGKTRPATGGQKRMDSYQNLYNQFNERREIGQ